jgi:hypothetical protein
MLRALAGLLFLLPAACSSAVYVQANLQCYGVGAALVGARGFRIEETPDSVHGLRDAAAARLVAAELAGRGLTERAADAAPEEGDLTCQVATDLSESSYYVPPQTRIVTSYRPGRTWRYRIEESDGSARWVTVHEPGEWLPESWTSGERTERVFTHRLEVSLRGADGRELWRAEVSAVTSSGDLMAVLRACVPLALAEFPTPTGLPADRTFTLP